ncbi:MAG TPA: transcription/translation regulatory transformer protein RfaH [Burkholderiaceae bacterium]|nr:transcription/translation regulatory transformer protein RfaH [Burkholderiaceae bacterium]
MNHWYLIHTKIRQERLALDNLERQGYECFLPLARVERIRKDALQVVEEPLFPRYLFIRLGTGSQAQSWSPIRSTLGVSRLVTFGQTPAKVGDNLVAHIRNQCADSPLVVRAFKEGDALVVTQGPFAGLDALYQTTDGEGRVMVLLNLLSKPVALTIEPNAVRKVAG